MCQNHILSTLHVFGCYAFKYFYSVYWASWQRHLFYGGHTYIIQLGKKHFRLNYCVRVKIRVRKPWMAIKVPRKYSTTNTCMCVFARGGKGKAVWQATWQLWGLGRCSGGQVKTWQAEKNLHSASGWKLRLTKRLTQESSQTVSSAVPSTNTPHRLDTPGFPLCWHPSPKNFSVFLNISWIWSQHLQFVLPQSHSSDSDTNIKFNKQAG